MIFYKHILSYFLIRLLAVTVVLSILIAIITITTLARSNVFEILGRSESSIVVLGDVILISIRVMPFYFMIASVLTSIAIQSSNQFIVMRVSGMSNIKIILPIMGFVMLFGFVFASFIHHYSTRIINQRNIMMNKIHLRSLPNEVDVSINDVDIDTNMRYLINATHIVKHDDRKEHFSSLLFIIYDEGSRVRSIMTANSATWDAINSIWTIYNAGLFTEVTKSFDIRRVMQIKGSLSSKGLAEQVQESMHLGRGVEYDIKHLYSKIFAKKIDRQDSTNGLQVKFWSVVKMPIMLLCSVMIGAHFSICYGRHVSLSYGIIKPSIVMVIYYGVIYLFCGISDSVMNLGFVMTFLPSVAATILMFFLMFNAKV